jgi:hypothetical protein
LVLRPAFTASAQPSNESNFCGLEVDGAEDIRPGDRVFFEPEENHWHGAAPNRFMVHIAMQQNDESGSPVTWGRHVTDEQYGASPTSAD